MTSRRIEIKRNMLQAKVAHRVKSKRSEQNLQKILAQFLKQFLSHEVMLRRNSPYCLTATRFVWMKIALFETLALFGQWSASGSASLKLTLLLPATLTLW